MFDLSFELSRFWFRVHVELIPVHGMKGGRWSLFLAWLLPCPLCPQQKPPHLVQAAAPSVRVSSWTPSWSSACVYLHVQAASS